MAAVLKQSELERLRGQLQIAHAELEASDARIVELHEQFNRESLSLDAQSTEAFRAIEDAESKVRMLESKIVAIDGAIEAEHGRIRVEERQARIAATDVQLRARIDLGDQFDAWIKEGGQLLKQMVKLNGAALSAMPSRPDDVPACFAPGSVLNLVSIKLYGWSEGIFLPRNSCLETPSTAREMPSMKRRLSEERERVLSQLTSQKAR